MVTSGTGHDRCPSLISRAHQAPGDWKIMKTEICFKGSIKFFRLRRDGTAASGSTGNRTFGLSLLGKSYAELDQPDDAFRSINEAKNLVERTEDRLYEADVHRIAGEIELRSPQPDAAKAEVHFERALSVARQQEAKSWELRAAMSMARLWRDQGKPQQARELLAPVYDWFTEGFNTLDLMEAKALLHELRA